MDISKYMNWCKSKYTHFIGIGGAGMSAIAAVLIEMGCKVSGSDLKLNGLAKKLRDKGAVIWEGHNGFKTDITGLVVVSSAIPRDNKELMEAKRANIPVVQRAEMLNILMRDKKGIVVTGSHGKTTTTSMISLIFEKTGLDPTVLIGGELNDIGGNAKLGKGDYLVAEGDESDGSFLKLFPHMAVITNIEDDHLDYYKNLENIKKAFSAFISQISPQGGVVVCKDSKNVKDIIENYRGNVVTYGIEEGADIFAKINYLSEFSSVSTIYIDGKNVGELKLNVPGKHNVCNALAALGVSLNAGLEFQDVVRVLEGFRGASRRFQVLYEDDDILVVDDYAHHPTEIKATLAAARKGWAYRGGRVIAIFQPHRYTRTFYLKEKFAKAFGDADFVFLTEIYSAGERPIKNVSSRLIYEEMIKNGYTNIEYIPNKRDIPEKILEFLQPGDLLLFMGAGDIWEEGVEVAHSIREGLFVT